ncbi:hypothetical protein BDV98DRAFT_551991 [Pterulicium gracile]|uniref:Uncharacterized protein n=1 Tax=Pterulicium gracile TaxID=1884261 RepID=A0A5C3QEM0_9AGAR|nr:hypothetical protein BDV98DRAFT_551991 [Pterula gracilis]
MFPVQKLAQRAQLHARTLHTTRPTARDLVGPLHPITNLRPILYSDIPASPASRALTAGASTSKTHPYSLSEFSHDEPARHTDIELQWRLHRVQTELFHHDFWLDSNTRFAAGTETVLSCLPAKASVADREAALSEFYKQWVTQEKDRMHMYTTAWRRRNFAGVMLGARVEWSRFAGRCRNAVTPDWIRSRRRK